MPPRTRTALIVGAGIGGLSAAIALQRAGWRVRVFEQRASPGEMGFGVGIAPNAVAALRKLGVGDTVVARGFAFRKGELRRIDGTIIKRAELPANSLGGPMLVALRPALHGALLEAAGLDRITIGTRITQFQQHDDRVALSVDGSAVEGDILIGADGVGSAIRQQLHPDQPSPRDSGIVAVRGAVHGAVSHLEGLDAIYYLGPGVESMFLRASDTGIYWFLSLARSVAPQGVTDPAEFVRRMAPQFDRSFQAMTSATGELRFDALVDRDPLPWWSQGRVTLLGDAAHPVLPQTGQGAAQAIVDAVTLGEMLTDEVSVPDALRDYERERLPKTAALLSQGRRTARVMAMTNPAGCFLRELAIRAMPITTFARLYAHLNRTAGTAQS